MWWWLAKVDNQAWGEKVKMKKADQPDNCHNLGKWESAQISEGTYSRHRPKCDCTQTINHNELLIKIDTTDRNASQTLTIVKKNENIIEDLINKNRRLKDHIKFETKNNIAVVITNHTIDTSALNRRSFI